MVAATAVNNNVNYHPAYYTAPPPKPIQNTGMINFINNMLTIFWDIVEESLEETD
jgi:hypothetical protein